MVLSLLAAAIGIAITAGLAGLAVRIEALTVRAGGVAFVFGSLIVTLAGFAYLALLALFVIASVLATRFRFDEKERRHVQEGTKGERGVPNVVSHILVPAALVMWNWLSPATLPSVWLGVLYSAALAFGASDTFASEFGVLAGGARSILTGRSVTPGTNGGVSAAGELWGLVGAIVTALVALAVIGLSGGGLPGWPTFLVVVSAAGFVGCHVDSILGEALENRGLLTKGGTNLVSMAATVALAAGLLAVR